MRQLLNNLYSYKMKHDTRFAPNPFFDVLTLATCKSAMRINTAIGNWIAGWMPALGQEKAVLGHLRKQGVGIEDLFLFFGSFRKTEFRQIPIICHPSPWKEGFFQSASK